jgi:hypothetical protein
MSLPLSQALHCKAFRRLLCPGGRNNTASAHVLYSLHLQGYGKMLSAFSPSIIGALTALNNLHMYLALGVPAFVCPDFRVEKVRAAVCD